MLRNLTVAASNCFPWFTAICRAVVKRLTPAFQFPRVALFVRYSRIPSIREPSFFSKLLGVTLKGPFSNKERTDCEEQMFKYAPVSDMGKEHENFTARRFPNVSLESTGRFFQIKVCHLENSLLLAFYVYRKSIVVYRRSAP